ncbi:MAG: LuxR C-terminal-related transcriptional regulator [Phycisphaeraceae bacterium]
MATATIDVLTPREREILILVGEGNSLAEIAQIIGRSLKTVESHRLSLGRKLKASNRVELARIAIANGLISLSGPDVDSADAAVSHTESSLELQWLEQINDAVFTAPGQHYIGALCQAITNVMGTRYCAVCMPDPKAPAHSRFTVSVAKDGQLLDPIWYHGPGTPAGTVAKDGVCIVKDNVQLAYPEDELMKSLGIQAYVGVRLKNALGDSPGIIAVSHDDSIEHAETIKRVLNFFVPRTSAELARMAQEKRLHDLNLKLQQYAMRSIEGQADGDGVNGGIDVKHAMQRLQLLMSTSSGSRLLSELADVLCEVTGVRYAAICMRDWTEEEPTLVTLTVSESARVSDTLRYPLEGTPCKIVTETGHYEIDDALADCFPEDQWVIDKGLQGYVGVRLDNANGEQLGVMWLVDDKPIGDPQQLLTILQTLTPRVAAEVEDRVRLDELHYRCEELESRINEISNEMDSKVVSHRQAE